MEAVRKKILSLTKVVCFFLCMCARVSGSAAAKGRQRAVTEAVIRRPSVRREYNTFHPPKPSGRIVVTFLEKLVFLVLREDDTFRHSSSFVVLCFKSHRSLKEPGQGTFLDRQPSAKPERLLTSLISSSTCSGDFSREITFFATH